MLEFTDFSIIWTQLPKILEGLWITILLTLFSIPLGFAVGLPVARARLSKNPLVKGVSAVYVFVFRGSPLLIQLFFVYNFLGALNSFIFQGSGFFRDFWVNTSFSFPGIEAFTLHDLLNNAFVISVFVLMLNSGAYTAEIFRGAFLSVDRGQLEAARAFGFSNKKEFWRIRFPAALRLAWPAYANEMLFLMHSTALVSLITVYELWGTLAQIRRKTYQVIPTLLSAAVGYIVLSLIIITLAKGVEIYLNRYKKMPGAERRRFLAVLGM